MNYKNVLVGTAIALELAACEGDPLKSRINTTENDLSSIMNQNETVENSTDALFDAFGLDQKKLKP